MADVVLEDATPGPEDFIKSIAEQGYRLETAIADLIDNSISAGADRIEVLLDTSSSPFRLFIADNGTGMDEQTLVASMKLPSSSIDANREVGDLGRFGLGLKTASFSQSRHFTVLSRPEGQKAFSARSWNIELLREHGWKIKVESESEVAGLLDDYNEVSGSLINAFSNDFEPRTIVIWRGLYKFEKYISENDCSEVLKRELSETTRGYLSLVFHRFLERSKKPLCIRLNNLHVKPFSPFPLGADGLRRLQDLHRRLGTDAIKIEGFVLPTRSVEESSLGDNQWAPQGKTLTDMEGVYIYRADRIILFGGWLGLVGRSQRHQLARLRVEIGNSADHLLHLNIAKSQVDMPHDLRRGFKEYVGDLLNNAEREYHNRTVRAHAAVTDHRKKPLIVSRATSRGAILELNAEFPLLNDLLTSLCGEDAARLKAILRILVTEMNRIRRVHEDTAFTGVEEAGPSQDDLLVLCKKLLSDGFSPEEIKTNLISALGYRVDTLPDAVRALLSKGA